LRVLLGSGPSLALVVLAVYVVGVVGLVALQ
jgi:hypothetical protein